MAYFKNTENSYSVFSRILHWATAIVVIFIIALGLYMEDLEKTPFKYEMYALHKSLGILILGLGLFRLLWLFISPPPKMLGEPSKKEELVAKFAHILLILFMIGMGLSGWLLSSSGGYPVKFFDIFELPVLIGKNHDIHELFEEIHEIGGFILIGLIILHILAALKHQFIKKDGTLKRMLCG